MKTGDILVSTFGYEARIATFWKVVGKTAKSVKIARMLDGVATGDWSDGTSSANPNSRLGKTVTKRVMSSYDGSDCVKTEYGYAYAWDGKPVKTYNHH